MNNNTLSAKAAEDNFRMQLVSMEVNNFKSFSGQPHKSEASGDEQAQSHIIGPFTNFTGIIGPNGVGKSNIFDAIAFALNLSLAPGKARHARELAHIPKKIGASPDDAGTESGSREFFVKLNFLKIDSHTNKSEKVSIQRGLKAKMDAATGEQTFYNEFIVNEN